MQLHATSKNPDFNWLNCRKLGNDGIIPILIENIFFFPTCTDTWSNTFRIYPAYATSSNLHAIRRLSTLFMQFGPFSRWSLRERPSCPLQESTPERDFCGFLWRGPCLKEKVPFSLTVISVLTCYFDSKALVHKFLNSFSHDFKTVFLLKLLLLGINSPYNNFVITLF